MRIVQSRRSVHSVFVGAIISAFVALAAASSSVAATTDAAASAGAKKKSTDLSFDDVLVQGKYHFSDEAVTTVEEDKVLDGLLGVRKDFKDRMKKSAARH